MIEKQMIIMTDRPQGVASFRDGEIEVNIERIANDDLKGVGENLDRRASHVFHHRILLR